MENTKQGMENIEIHDDHAVLRVNPRIYPLELVYSAAYIMIDKAFILLDGDPEKSVVVEIRKRKKDQDLNDLIREFNEELLNYAVYKVQSEKNKRLREIILYRALLTNTVPQKKNDDRKMEDPDNIMKTWEETHSKEDKEDGHRES